MMKSVLFVKLFMANFNVKLPDDTEEQVTRQLLLRRSFIVDANGNEQIAAETTTADNKQIALTISVPSEEAQSSFDSFNEETAKALMDSFCTRTLEQINESQDIDVNVTGVNYD